MTIDTNTATNLATPLTLTPSPANADVVKVAGVRAWRANSIPLPSEARRGDIANAAAGIAPQNDLFPKGEIVKFFPNLSYGFVRDQNGRELFFHTDEVDLLGAHGRREFIRIGAKVGYDCCRTSNGLRVKRMKIY